MPPIEMKTLKNIESFTSFIKKREKRITPKTPDENANPSQTFGLPTLKIRLISKKGAKVKK